VSAADLKALCLCSSHLPVWLNVIVNPVQLLRHRKAPDKVVRALLIKVAAFEGGFGSAAPSTLS
jgi:hypothetical protein